MGTNTPNRGYPIPDGSDAASGLAGYIASLGAAIDADVDAAVHDTTWQDFTITAPNFTAEGVPPGWDRVGRLVVIRGTLSRTVVTPSGIDWNGANVFNTLPLAARPAYPVMKPVMTATTTNSLMEIKVDTDGGIQFRNTGGADLPAASIFGCFVTFLAG